MSQEEGLSLWGTFHIHPSSPWTSLSPEPSEVIFFSNYNNLSVDLECVGICAYICTDHNADVQVSGQPAGVGVSSPVHQVDPRDCQPFLFKPFTGQK